MTIEVYTAENCQPCKATKRALQKAGLSFLELDAQEHADKLKEMGYAQLPVVILDDGVSGWSGFRPDLIKEIQVE